MICGITSICIVSLRTSLTVISCTNKSAIFIMFVKISALMCLVAVAQAQKAEHRSGDSEDSARLLFSNYTSGKSNDFCDNWRVNDI